MDPNREKLSGALFPLKIPSLPFVTLGSSLRGHSDDPAAHQTSTDVANTPCLSLPPLCFLCYLLFKFSSLSFVTAKARTSQPANIPSPPNGVIAPNHLKLVSAKAYKEPLKTITPASIR
jgi:hypothetical protein